MSRQPVCYVLWTTAPLLAMLATDAAFAAKTKKRAAQEVIGAPKPDEQANPNAVAPQAATVAPAVPEFYTAIIVDDPTGASLYCQRGWSQLNALPEVALLDFDRALRLNRRFAGALYGRGLARAAAALCDQNSAETAPYIGAAIERKLLADGLRRASSQNNGGGNGPPPAPSSTDPNVDGGNRGSAAPNVHPSAPGADAANARGGNRTSTPPNGQPPAPRGSTPNAGGSPGSTPPIDPRLPDQFDAEGAALAKKGIDLFDTAAQGYLSAIADISEAIRLSKRDLPRVTLASLYAARGDIWCRLWHLSMTLRSMVGKNNDIVGGQDVQLYFKPQVLSDLPGSYLDRARESFIQSLQQDTHATICGREPVEQRLAALTHWRFIDPLIDGLLDCVLELAPVADAAVEEHEPNGQTREDSPEPQNTPRKTNNAMP